MAAKLALVDDTMQPPPARRAVHTKLQMPTARLLTKPDFREEVAAKIVAKDTDVEEMKKRKAERG